MNTYDIGDLIVFSATFSVANVPTVPTTVTCAVRDPSGAVTPLLPAASATGSYTATYAPTMQGFHWVRWAGTGAAQAAEETQFSVRQRHVGT